MNDKKRPTKKSATKHPPKNPTDPNLLARDVMETFLGEPLTAKTKPKRKSAKAKKK